MCLTCWMIYIHYLFFSQNHPCKWRNHWQKVSVIVCIFSRVRILTQYERWGPILFGINRNTWRKAFPRGQLFLRRPVPPWDYKMLCEPLWWWECMAARFQAQQARENLELPHDKERSLAVDCSTLPGSGLVSPFSCLGWSHRIAHSWGGKTELGIYEEFTRPLR